MAVTVNAGGLLRAPVLVTVKLPVPATEGVKVKVKGAVDPAGMVMVCGKNVPVRVQRGTTVIAFVLAVPLPGVMV